MMDKLVPYNYMLTCMLFFIVVWYVNPEDRVFNIACALPGMFVGTFTILWKKILKLEQHIEKMEGYISKLESELSVGK